MLVAIQFPIADLRCLHSLDSGRLRRPEWPNLALDRPGSVPFVRGFGRAHKRNGGGVAGWPGEEVYCDLAHGLRFQGGVDGPPIVMRQGSLRARCAYRRLHSDGRVVARVEVGLNTSFAPPPDSRWAAQGFSAPAITETVKRLLAIAVRVRVDERTMQGTTLFRAGAPLSKAYLRSTTKVLAYDALTPDRRRAYVEEGAPVVVVQYTPNEIESLPLEATPVDGAMVSLNPTANGAAPASSTGPIAFARLAAPERGADVPVWFVRSENMKKNGADDVADRTRVHLFRLHAECDCLGAVLRLAARSATPPWTDDDTLRKLDRYLDDATSLLGKDKRAGVAHDPVFDMLTVASSGVLSAPERATLMDSVGAVRSKVRVQLDKLLESNRAPMFKIGTVVHSTVKVGTVEAGGIVEGVTLGGQRTDDDSAE